jgi:hypothetical protein
MKFERRDIYWAQKLSDECFDNLLKAAVELGESSELISSEGIREIQKVIVRNASIMSMVSKKISDCAIAEGAEEDEKQTSN